MRKIIYSAAVVATTLLVACGGYKTTENGLKYKILAEGEGKKIETGDYVTLQMAYKTDKDSVLFDTYKMKQPVKLIITKSDFDADLMDGLTQLHKGDSAEVLINADSLFKKTFGITELPKYITAGSNIIFTLKIIDVKNKQEMESEMAKMRADKVGQEKAIIDAFVKEKQLTTTSTASGLQYVITKQGAGELPVIGDLVKVHYEGRFLDGKKFDSSYDLKQPFEFPIGQGKVVKGWDEALLLFNKGTKATIILPSFLAYGEQGAGGVIPPFTPLVFDIELLSITKAK